VYRGAGEQQEDCYAYIFFHFVVIPFFRLCGFLVVSE